MTKIVITTDEKEENAWAYFLISKEDMPAIIEYAQKLHSQRRDAVEHCVELSSDKQTCTLCGGKLHPQKDGTLHCVNHYCKSVQV